MVSDVDLSSTSTVAAMLRWTKHPRINPWSGTSSGVGPPRLGDNSGVRSLRGSRQASPTVYPEKRAPHSRLGCPRHPLAGRRSSRLHLHPPQMGRSSRSGRVDAHL